MIEHFCQCPYCWEEISILIDPSQGHQKYIEDCEVCCNPMAVKVSLENGIIEEFQAKSIEQ